jgi:hypothetical protein
MEPWQIVTGVILILLALAVLVHVMKKKEPPGGEQAPWPDYPPSDAPAPGPDVETKDTGGGGPPSLPK